MSRTTFSGTPSPSSTVYSIAEQDTVYPAATARMSPPEQIERAGAYHFLGLHDEAMECLEFLPDALRNDRDINVLRLSILQGQGNWPAAAALAKSTLPARPASPEFYVMGAYAIRRQESIEAATPSSGTGRLSAKRRRSGGTTWPATSAAWGTWNARMTCSIAPSPWTSRIAT